jgi:hypothetical protein
MRNILWAGVLVATFVVPAFGDEAPKKGSDADEAFMAGIRKLGVMSGEAYACSKEDFKCRIEDLAATVSARAAAVGSAPQERTVAAISIPMTSIVTSRTAATPMSTEMQPSTAIQTSTPIGT